MESCGRLRRTTTHVGNPCDSFCEFRQYVTIGLYLESSLYYFFQDAVLFKREFETAQSINTNLAKGLSPAEAVKAATAKKDEKVEQKDRDETAEGKGTKEQDKEDEEKKDGA